MPDFVNTIDILGDEVVADSIINRTITEYADDRAACVGENAFYGCNGLTKVNMPNLTEARYSAFEGCTNLHNIKMPSLTTIYDNAFKNCSSLKHFDFTNVGAFSSNAFEGSGLIEVTISGDCMDSNKKFENWKNLKIADVDCNNFYTDCFDGNTSLTALILRRSDAITKLCTADGSTSTIPSTAKIYVPSALLNTYKADEAWSAYSSQFLTIEAYSHSGTSSDGLSWNIKPGGLITISGNGAMTDYNGYSSMPWYSYRSNITMVKFEDGITHIGNYAFRSHQNLTHITIPESVTSIGDSAFGYCAITSVVIPDSVTSIGASAFYECASLTSVVLGNGITSISHSLFYGCRALNTIVIPNSVTSIGESAFQSCHKLASVVIPDNVTNIGSSAFSSCEGLTELSIGAGLSNIPERAFWGCMKINRITVSDENTKYFVDPYGVLLDKDQKVIVRASTSISGDYEIPSTVTKIYHNAFCNCADLTSIMIPPSVTSMGDYIFFGCASLTSLIIPDTVTSVGSQSVYGCSGLTELVIGRGLTSMSGGLLSACSKLQRLTIPCIYNINTTATSTYQMPFGNLFKTSSANGYTAVSQTYYGASTTSKTTTTYYIPNSLKSVTVTGGRILLGAFQNITSLTDLTIGDNVSSVNWVNGFNGSTILNGITISENNTYYSKDEQGLIYNKSKSMICYAPSTISGDITIPSSVTQSQSDAFAHCSGLTGVHITDIATWLGITFMNAKSNPLYYAKKLYQNGELVTDVVVPDELSKISMSAFYNCASLTSITIPDSVTSIGAYAFYGCTGLTSITIPDSVTSMPAHIFDGCSGLQHITIPCVSQTTKTWSDTYQYPLGNLFGTNQYTGSTAVRQYYYGSSTSSETNAVYYFPSSLKSVTITGGIITCGAFFGLPQLTSVVIGANVAGIARRAFYNCDALTSATFENTEGWWVSSSNSATSGTSVDVTDAATAAKYLNDTYAYYYWNRT